MRCYYYNELSNAGFALYARHGGSLFGRYGLVYMVAGFLVMYVEPVVERL